MSNPQEPYKQGQPDAGQTPQWPQHPPAAPQHGAPDQQPPAPQYGAPDQQPAPGQYQAPSQYQAPEQYGAGPVPFGLPGQPPPAKSRKGLWIILGIVGGVLLLVAVGVIILMNVVGGATNQAKGLADNFTKLVISGETDKAYDEFLDPKLQEQLSKEDFATGVESLEMDDTCKPAYDDLKVSSENGTNVADVAGLITCDGKQVELAYRFEGTGELKMINIKLKPRT